MPIGGGGLGIGGIIIVVLIGWALGINPMQMLGMLSNQQGGVPGMSTRAPRLVLFSRMVQSACGQATSASGPFYCPGDRQVYIDLAFFEEVRARFGGGGNFAEAYVIAHEVGHQIQTIAGVSATVNDARRSGQEVEGDGGLLVRQELQADCYAGVWAHHAQARHQWLEPGDIEEALNTASAIGDDRLQKQSRGVVVPDSFSHGTSEQRVRWFSRGLESWQPNDCDTFAAAALQSKPGLA